MIRVASEKEEKQEAAEKAERGLTAEDMAKDFKEHSVAEFFKKNMQMLGLTGKIKTLTTIVHEYVTNSLDACEEAKILPDLEVQIKEIGNEYYEVTAKDNGPGLTKETVGKALGKLLAGTKFHRMVQMRGQQGIGASGCTMLSQITTGKAVQVITGTGKGKPLSLDITIDPKHNEPKLANIQEIDKDFKGTIIRAKFKGVKYVNSEQAPLEYLRRTAIANPHAQITLIEPNGEKIAFKRTHKEIPARPMEMKPHPKGVKVDELVTLAKYSSERKVSSFLKNNFDRFGDKAVEDIQKNVSFDINKDPKQLSWEEAEEIVNQFKKINFIAPRTDGLIPIGEPQIRKSLETIVKPEFISVVTRKPSVYSGGFPFQVEVGIAYGGEAGRVTEANEEGVAQRKIEIMRFANRAPLLFDSGGCAITKAVQSIDWKRYGMKDFENAPLTIFVNLISVHIPYTSAGKQAISDEDEIMEELRLALMDTGRKIYTFVGKQKRLAEKEAKRKMYYKYATEVAYAVAELTGKSKKDIEAKLHSIVLKHLKLEEQREKEALEKGEMTEEEIEAEYEKRRAREKKEAEKNGKGKKSAAAEESGEGE
ncbi:Type 2 DNA topoisomerase 6 subunit B [uncultured archaeon]|nr:Type 2 DNA topoisomerase 6 subunit B [uncultured archaeon]